MNAGRYPNGNPSGLSWHELLGLYLLLLGFSGY